MSLYPHARCNLYASPQVPSLAKHLLLELQHFAAVAEDLLL